QTKTAARSDTRPQPAAAARPGQRQPIAIAAPDRPSSMFAAPYRSPGIWGRLRRTLFGESKPVFED
ncbi:MAG: hypothetical protein AB7J63_08375, partial [Vicinamibacterales bacterium]